MTNLNPLSGEAQRLEPRTEGPTGKRDQKEFRVKEHDPEKTHEKEPEKIKIKESQNGLHSTLVIDQTLDLIIKDMSIQVAELKEVKSVSAIQMTDRIDTINQLIVDNVAKVYASEAGAIVTLNTDSARDVPDLFKGSQIHLAHSDEGLLVEFTLAKGVSEFDAAKLIKENAVQLREFAEKVQLQKMMVGGTEIVLSEVIDQPKIAPLSRPFEAQAGREQKQGQGQDQEQEGEEK